LEYFRKYSKYEV